MLLKLRPKGVCCSLLFVVVCCCCWPSRQTDNSRTAEHTADCNELVRYNKVNQLINSLYCTDSQGVDHSHSNVSHIHTELAYRAFSVAAASTWNSLPTDI